MNNGARMQVPLIGGSLQQEQQKTAFVLAKRLDIAASVLGHIVAVEYARGMSKADDASDAVGGVPTAAHLNVEQAVNVSLVAAELLLCGVGLMQPGAPEPGA